MSAISQPPEFCPHCLQYNHFNGTPSPECVTTRQDIDKDAKRQRIMELLRKTQSAKKKIGIFK